MMVAFNENGQGYWTFEEVVEHAAVKEMLENFVGSQVVKEGIRMDFYRVFNRHMKAWSYERMERDYGLKNLVEVTWNKEEQCFHVHYKNGDWWHYTLSGEWY